MAIILSSHLCVRAFLPLRPTSHNPLLSLLWAVWTLIDEPYVRTIDGSQRTDERDSPFLFPIMHYWCTVPLGSVTHVRLGRRYAEVQLSATASVCPCFQLLFFLSCFKTYNTVFVCVTVFIQALLNTLLTVNSN